MNEIVPAASAQSPDAPTISPERAASDSRDFSALHEARAARLAGTPLPRVEQDAPTDPAAPADRAARRETPPNPQSKRQQDMNDRVAASVARATADLSAENARLRANQPAPAPPQHAAAQKPAPRAPRFPDYASYLQQAPEASLEDWMDARDTYRDQVRVYEGRTKAAQEHEQAWHGERVGKFTSQITQAKTADPQFHTKLSPDVAALEPAAIAIAEGRPLTVNNAIAEEVMDSPMAAALMLHLSQRPDVLQQLRTAQTPRELARRVGSLEKDLASGSVATGAAPVPPSRNRAGQFQPSISAAPPPPPVLTKPGTTSDPKAAALARRDFPAFRAARDQERLARAHA